MDSSIKYPLIAAPPLSGAVHERLIVVLPEALAVSPVGASGSLAGVVALAGVEGELLPSELIANTR